MRSFLVTASEVRLPSLTSVVNDRSLIFQLVSWSGALNENVASPDDEVCTKGWKKAVSANALRVSTSGASC